jgi:hypothetical protein
MDPHTVFTPRPERLSRYKKLLAELRAANSNAEAADADVQQGVDEMKFWIAQELAFTAGRALTFEVRG